METENGKEQRSFALSIPVPWSKEPFKVRGMSAVLALLLAATSILAWASYEHKNETASSNLQLAAAINNMAVSQRELACVIRLPVERRELAYTECQKIARGQ